MKLDQKVEIIWIDDEMEDHSEDAKYLEYARKGLSVKIVHPSDLPEYLSEMKGGRGIPDLFLVDYFLDQVESKEKRKFERRGLTVAGMLREIDPERPIYVVSQKGEVKNGIFISEAHAAKESFDRVLAFKEIQREGHDILYYDAIDYRALREASRLDLTALFNLLKAPEDVRERLRLIVPTELRKGLSDSKATEHPEGNTMAFTRWTREILLSVPGFLYDELHAATYLGLSVESFEKISSEFDDAKYSGIFAKTAPQLWWVSELNSILFSHPKAQESKKTNPWELAPEVYEIPEEEQTKCVVCGGSHPETVGVNSKDSGDLKPVHYRCSELHPDMRRELFFDEPRGFEVPNSS
ncbi:MAG TPA: hypothetical protein VMW67_07495 [Desulfobacteria bacterium]|nr:hypothetical protein [Desulfobacteria bacterium]